jgi:primase-like protein
VAKGDARKLRDELRTDPDAKIPEGKRRETIFRFACSQRAFGLPPESILESAKTLNREKCRVPLSDEQVEHQVKGALEYESATTLPRAAEPDSDLEEVVATYRRWLNMPDPVPLYVALAAVLANRMEEGDPLWLMIVGGSSRGKTEILVGLSGLKSVRTMGSLSEAALLSGTPKKDQAKDAKGGLLHELPKTGGVLLVKDFGAILSMPRERRASVLQALREIYDGRYTRDVGTSGALKLEWEGRLGFIAGATGKLDRAHAVISALGERWLTLRLGDDTARSSARAALRHSATARMARSSATLSAATWR